MTDTDYMIRYKPLSLVLSVESAASLLRMPKIIESIQWETKSDAQPVVEITALLFAR